METKVMSEILAKMDNESESMVNDAIRGIVELCKEYGNAFGNAYENGYSLDVVEPIYKYVNEDGNERVIMNVTCKNSGIYGINSERIYKFSKDELVSVFRKLCKLHGIKGDDVMYSIYCLDEDGNEVDCADWIATTDVFPSKYDAMDFVATYGFGLGLTKRRWGIKAVTIKKIDKHRYTYMDARRELLSVQFPYGQCDECCPNCGKDVIIETSFRLQVCPECGSFIVPCNMCEHDLCDCENCPLEKYRLALESKMGDRTDMSRNYQDAMKDILNG